MGMEYKVEFSIEADPLWPALNELLAKRGFPVQLRMMDGELAFPDETPPANWRELRLGTPQGMVSLRRQQDGVSLLVWGNADAALRQAWKVLTWACAEVTGGQIVTEVGKRGAKEFLNAADLPPGFCENPS